MNKMFLFLILIGFLALAQINAQDYYNELPIPYRVQGDVYHLSINYEIHDFDPGKPNSPLNNIFTYSYNHIDSIGTPSELTLLGPTLAWSYLHDINIKVKNNLDHGATVHWHGAHVPPHADGGPHQVIQPNTTWDIDIQVLDKSSTMWYHPHVMNFTYEQVQMGMSGMLYAEDPEDGNDKDDENLVRLHKLLPTEYGINDFPIIIQTKVFTVDANNTDSVYIELGETERTKSDYEYIINGVVNPYLKVPNEMTRLRLLCGEARYAFNLGIIKDGNPVTTQLIATDAGYTDKSYSRTKTMFSPGERMEWIVDFSQYENGDTLYLYNYSSELPDGIIGKNGFKGVQTPDTTLLAFIVDSSIEAPQSEITSFPIDLKPKEVFDTTNAFVRRKTLRKDQLLRPDNGKVQNIYNIDSTVMNMMFVNDTVILGSTEIWEIKNTTDVAHPWHIHLTHFYVTEILDSNGVQVDEADYPNIFGGPLDNVLILPGWTLRYAIEFKNFGVEEIRPEDSYMYHCHILPHEDGGMMGQFVVWDTTGTSVKDIVKLDNKLVVYPNPSSDYVYLEGSSDYVSNVRFIDITGNVVKEAVINPFKGSYLIPTSDLPKGMYFLEWNSNGKVSTCKVMIE